MTCGRLNVGMRNDGPYHGEGKLLEFSRSFYSGTNRYREANKLIISVKNPSSDAKSGSLHKTFQRNAGLQT